MTERTHIAPRALRRWGFAVALVGSMLAVSGPAVAAEPPPALGWAAAFGGTELEEALAVAVDAAGIAVDAAGNDSLQGFGGDDDLFGNAGDDLLNGRDGDDLLDGGAGSDRATYLQAQGPVTVDLRISGPQATGDGTDTLVGIVNLTGSDFADLLIGNAQPNLIFGGMGDDTLQGRSGNDTLRGNEDNDTANGGPGTDACTAETETACE